jgi:hypothetical protein
MFIPEEFDGVRRRVGQEIPGVVDIQTLLEAFLNMSLMKVLSGKR